MKKFIKIICLCLSAIVLFSVSACGSNGDSGKETGINGSITVKVFNGGYKIAWIKKMAQQFKADTGIAVDVKDTTDTSGWDTEIRSGTSTTDIYFNSAPGLDYFYKDAITVGGVRYDCQVADLTDLFNTLVPGESVLYKDKMISNIRNTLNYDLVYNYETKQYEEKSQTGKYYTTSWANGSVSFVVNMNKWKDSYGEFPNTTDELFDLCKKVIDDQKSVNVNTRMYPFAYSLKTSYWKFIFEAWAYQYMGQQEYNAFVNGYDKSGNQYTKELLRYEGFLEALKCIDECIKARGNNNELCYSHPNSTSDDFTTTQFKLLNGRGLMQPNGNWLVSEMNSSYKGQDLNVQFKKVPVISSIIDRCSSIADDKELSALITAIDNGSSELSGEGYDVSQADYDRVYYARNLVITMGNSHGAYIPSYSKNLDKAKQFLLYMATDKYLEIYYKETLGSTLPFNYDYSRVGFKVSALIESESEMTKGAILQPLSMANNNKLAFFNRTLFNGMCMPYQINGEAEVYMSAVNASDRKSAQDIYDENYSYANKNWATTYEQYCW